MSKINRLPLGLQGVLFNRNFGVNPDELAQEVGPGIDMYPFYAANQLHGAAGFVVATAVGDSFTIAQPQDEIWDIETIDMKLITAGASEARVEVNTDVINPGPPPGAVTTRIAVSDFPTAVGTAGVLGSVQHFGDVFFFPPGQVYRFVVDDINLAGQPSVTFSGSIMYRRWPV